MSHTESPTGGERPSEQLKATAREATAEVAREIRGGIEQGAAQVRDQAAARTEEAKQGFAREMAATAEALETASRDLGENSLQRSMLQEASKGLAGIAEAVQGRSAGELVHELAEFGRRNPVAFLGGATLAGFALARLATASAPAGAASTPGDWPEPHASRAIDSAAPSYGEPAAPSYGEGVSHE
jgi:hypothetical protein